jgi:hypothetical protein
MQHKAATRQSSACPVVFYAFFYIANGEMALVFTLRFVAVFLGQPSPSFLFIR